MYRRRGVSVILCIMLFSSVASGTEISDFINQRNCDQILDKGYYQICYDYGMKGARYVGYLLHADLLKSGDIKKRPSFYPDRDIPAQYRTKSGDYTRNEFGADRGHLASDASFDYSPEALHSVYSMANIIPQYSSINRHTWIKAERYERQVAMQLGKVWVVNGVVYGTNPQRLLKSGIAYPKAFWKMLYDNQGFERCLYYSNDSQAVISGDKLRDHEVSCPSLLHGEIKVPDTGVTNASQEKAGSGGGREYLRGSRGGCYYYTSGGNKKYVSRSLCE